MRIEVASSWWRRRVLLWHVESLFPPPLLSSPRASVHERDQRRLAQQHAVRRAWSTNERLQAPCLVCLSCECEQSVRERRGEGNEGCGRMRAQTVSTQLQYHHRMCCESVIPHTIDQHGTHATTLDKAAAPPTAARADERDEDTTHLSLFLLYCLLTSVRPSSHSSLFFTPLPLVT